MTMKMRRRGGAAGEEKIVKHHEKMDDLDYAKDIGPVRGEHGKSSAARSPRKSGGGVSPFSAAKAGTKPAGRHTMSGD